MNVIFYKISCADSLFLGLFNLQNISLNNAFPCVHHFFFFPYTTNTIRKINLF